MLIFLMMGIDGGNMAESSQEQQVSQKILVCSFLQDVHVY